LTTDTKVIAPSLQIGVVSWYRVIIHQ